MITATCAAVQPAQPRSFQQEQRLQRRQPHLLAGLDSRQAVSGRESPRPREMGAS